MTLARLLSRCFLRLRRAGIFSSVGVFHFLLSSSYKCTHFSNVPLLKPIELISGSKLGIVKKELDLLKRLKSKEDFNLYFLNLRNEDRNSQFRINAFYPLFYLLNESKYHDLVVRFVIYYCETFIVKKKANKFVWYDMADAFRLSFLLHIYTDARFSRILSCQDKVVLKYSISRHIKYVSSPIYQAAGNHGIFQIVSTYLYGKSCQNIHLINQAKCLLEDKFFEQFSKNGVHLEHSPEYHIWAVILFTYIKDDIIDLYVFRLLEEATKFSRLLFNTSNEISLIGDSGIEHSFMYSKIVEVSKRNSFNFFCSNDGYLISTDYSRGFYFISHFGAHSKIHKHSDSTTFELDIDGNKIITDGGKFSYTKSSFSKSLRHPSAHNIVKSELLANLSYLPTVLYEAKELQVTKLVVNGQHTRFFITIVKFGVVVIDKLLNGQSISSLNFTSRTFLKFFTPLIGVNQITTSRANFSDTYLEKKESLRVTMVVNSLSAYSILSEPEVLNEFKLLNNSFSFNFKGKFYQFSLE